MQVVETHHGIPWNTSNEGQAIPAFHAARQCSRHYRKDAETHMEQKNLTPDTISDLIRKAFDAQTRSYSPYSQFAVGAALMGRTGAVYQGCNIENASYTPTNCAERTAYFKAVSEGVTEFDAIAIVGNKRGLARGEGDYCSPCGVCRQVMREFCNPETFQIILAKSETEYRVYTLDELLPQGFGPENLR